MLDKAAEFDRLLRVVRQAIENNVDWENRRVVAFAPLVVLRNALLYYDDPKSCGSAWPAGVDEARDVGV